MTFYDSIKVDDFEEVINAPIGGTQIGDLCSKLLICEESGNDVFRFPWSKKPRMDFLRPYQQKGEF